MKNQITASIQFCFRGENHDLSLDLDLDKFLAKNGCIPDLYPLIARANNFDLYSYEYEMMQTETIIFSNPAGMVAEHVSENKLDIKTFQSAWHENQILGQLEKIATSNMSINNLKQHPELLDSLLQAYHLGKNSKTK